MVGCTGVDGDDFLGFLVAGGGGGEAVGGEKVGCVFTGASGLATGGSAGTPSGLKSNDIISNLKISFVNCL